MQAAHFISKGLQLKESNVSSALTLFDEGATIPFISRYRKERTDGLDEVQLQAIKDSYKSLLDLEKRRAFVLESIEV